MYDEEQARCSRRAMEDTPPTGLKTLNPLVLAARHLDVQAASDPTTSVPFTTYVTVPGGVIARLG